MKPLTPRALAFLLFLTGAGARRKTALGQEALQKHWLPEVSRP